MAQKELLRAVKEDEKRRKENPPPLLTRPANGFSSLEPLIQGILGTILSLRSTFASYQNIPLFLAGFDFLGLRNSHCHKVRYFLYLLDYIEHIFSMKFCTTTILG